MKKLLGIVVLGLLLSGCATKVGLNNNSDNNKYVAMTSMVPAGGMGAKNSKSPTIAHEVGHMITFWTLGMYSPKYFDFYAYDDDQNTAKNKSIQKCKDFSRKKNWDKKIECVYIKANLTLKETNYTQSTQSTSSNSVSFTASIGKHKNTCKELGFKPGTESFANCGLKLIEAEVAQSGNRQALQQIQIIKQEPAYDGWMGELGLSILRGDYDRKVRQPAYRFPPSNTRCTMTGAYLNCTTY